MSISLNQGYKNLHLEPSNMEPTMFTTAVPDSNRINNNLVPKQHDYHVSLDKLKRINKKKSTQTKYKLESVCKIHLLFQSWINAYKPYLVARLEQQVWTVLDGINIFSKQN